MGRRSFWCNLSNKDNKLSLHDILDILYQHNTTKFDDRGETIDVVYKFDKEYKDGSHVNWLYFSSGGGDWATMDFFEINYPDFYKTVERLDDFEEFSDEHEDWRKWPVNGEYDVWTIR